MTRGDSATSGGDGMDLQVVGDIWHWRGPAPYYFVTVPDEECARLQAVSRAVTYGWGMIPVRARIGGTEWRTSLFPKDGGYLVPLKDAVRRAEAIDEGDTVTVRLTVGSAPGRPEVRPDPGDGPVQRLARACEG